MVLSTRMTMYPSDAEWSRENSAMMLAAYARSRSTMAWTALVGCAISHAMALTAVSMEESMTRA